MGKTLSSIRKQTLTFRVYIDMKASLLILPLLLILISSCGSPTDSGMTKKKTITANIEESKASAQAKSTPIKEKEEAVIIPKARSTSHRLDGSHIANGVYFAHIFTTSGNHKVDRIIKH